MEAVTNFSFNIGFILIKSTLNQCLTGKYIEFILLMEGEFLRSDFQGDKKISVLNELEYGRSDRLENPPATLQNI